jgi:murein DD-endopeptidase MepM/ murein hydrolase activator NlpD
MTTPASYPVKKSAWDYRTPEPYDLVRTGDRAITIDFPPTKPLQEVFSPYDGVVRAVGPDIGMPWRSGLLGSSDSKFTGKFPAVIIEHDPIPEEFTAEAGHVLESVLFPVFADPTIHEGQRLKAGQMIGTANGVLNWELWEPGTVINSPQSPVDWAQAMGAIFPFQVIKGGKGQPVSSAPLLLLLALLLGGGAVLALGSRKKRGR